MPVKVVTRKVEVESVGEGEVLDITEEAIRAVSSSGLVSGVATVFVTGSTAAVTTIEYEPGLARDFPEMLSRLAPKTGVAYDHHRRWHDGNGHSHVKAALVGPSITVPFVDGRLVLGEWQQVVLVELDIRPRKRTIVIQVIGE